MGITPEMLELEDTDSRTCAKHNFILKSKKGRTVWGKYSFVNRFIPEWNDLAAIMVEAVTLVDIHLHILYFCL